MELGRLGEGEGEGEGEGRGRGGGGEGEEPIENMLYQSILSGKHHHGNATYVLPYVQYVIHLNNHQIFPFAQAHHVVLLIQW